MKKPAGKGGYTSSHVRPTTRLAIYLRDGLHCVYCLKSYLEDGLTLDHVHGREGGHGSENLLTSCLPCNVARRYDRLLAKDVRQRVLGQLQIPLDHFRFVARKTIKSRPFWYVELLRISKQRFLAGGRGEVPTEDGGDQVLPEEAGEEIPF